jgi:hypothetical protein
VHFCTSKASQLSTSDQQLGVVARLHAPRLRQYVYFCTSKAIKLSTWHQQVAVPAAQARLQAPLPRHSEVLSSLALRQQQKTLTQKRCADGRMDLSLLAVLVLVQKYKY